MTCSILVEFLFFSDAHFGFHCLELVSNNIAAVVQIRSANLLFSVVYGYWRKQMDFKKTVGHAQLGAEVSCNFCEEMKFLEDKYRKIGKKSDANYSDSNGTYSDLNEGLLSRSSVLIAEVRECNVMPQNRLRLMFTIDGLAGLNRFEKFGKPNAVTGTSQNEIIVADPDLHQIMVFRSDGSFKLAFGSGGPDGRQLHYPTGVAFCSLTNRIIVIERSPAHQIQVFTNSGQFIKNFGSAYLRCPRAVTVDAAGQIIVVESRIMQVTIFSKDGEFLSSFTFAGLQFPNSVAVDNKENILVCDNRAHCVRVFTYAGHHIRNIGSEVVTPYPIGVNTTPTGEVLIATNFMNFTVSRFTYDGVMLSATKSCKNHARCFGTALIGNGLLAVAAADANVFVYRFPDGSELL